MLTDATVTVTRGGAAIPNMQHIPVKIKPASPMNLSMDGVQVATNLLGDNGMPGAPRSWHVNDIMTLENAGAFQVASYTVKSAIPPPPNARPRLALWNITVGGAVR